jgi:hypothetical protein
MEITHLTQATADATVTRKTILGAKAHGIEILLFSLVI